MKIKIHVTKIQKTPSEDHLLISSDVKLIGELATDRCAVIFSHLKGRLNSLLEFYNYLEELRPMCEDLEVTGIIDEQSWKEILQCFNDDRHLAERWADILVNVCQNKPLYA